MDLEKIEDLSQLRQIEAESVGLKDLRLETQLKFLIALKDVNDCEKGHARGLGFGNSWILNRNRSSKVYTVAESKFRQLAESFEIRQYCHELPIKTKNSHDLSLHCYKLDFFFPKCRIAVEISPDFHFSYKHVFIRDKLRKKALKKHGITTYTVKSNKFNEINVKYARKILHLIKAAHTSPECLEYWLNEAELLNNGNIAAGTEEPQKQPEFKIRPIPRLDSNNPEKPWRSFGFGLVDGLYSEKGVWYLPNYSDGGKNAVESLEYRINSSDSQNGSFKWVVKSLIHESLHSTLFDEIGEKSAQLDNIDKTEDGYYIISEI